VPDAALQSVFEQGLVDVVLVGADTVLSSGAVVNKVGTHLLALGARQHRIPCYAAASCDKVSFDTNALLEVGSPDRVYRGDAPVEVFSPLFELTPGKLLSGIITEDGVLAPVEMQDVAFERKALAQW
jgi:translation initiation factor 2B subunit (eIF-2B alpha/beta/delta family)